MTGSTLYFDPQTAAVLGFCPYCGGELYDRDGWCPRCKISASEIDTESEESDDGK